MENTTGFQLDRDMGKQHFFLIFFVCAEFLSQNTFTVSFFYLKTLVFGYLAAS